MKVLDIIDVPRNLIANILGTAAGVDKSKKERATLGIPRVSFSDLLGKLGMKKGAARSVAGLAGDNAIDPLTYFSFGATGGLKIAQHLPRVLKAGKAGLMAARAGKMAPKLSKALGLRKPWAKTLARFTQMAKKRGIKDVPKYLMGKRGGVLTKRLVRMADEGHKPTLRWLHEFGEKGRSVFRIPGMDVGAPILKFGARARKARAVTAGLTDVGQAGFAKAAKYAKHARVVSAINAGNRAMAAMRKGQAAQASKELGAFRFLMETPEVKRLHEQYDMLQGMYRQLQKQAKARSIAIPKPTVPKTKDVLESLAGKFEVTPGGEKALRASLTQRRKAEKAVIGTAKRGIEAPLPEAGLRPVLPEVAKGARGTMKMRVAGAKKGLIGQLRGEGTLAQRKLAQGERLAMRISGEKVAFETGPLAPGVLQEKARATLGPRYLRGAQKGILPKLHQLRRTWFGAPRGPVKQQMVGIEALTGPVAAKRGAGMTAVTAKQLEPIITELATDPKVLAQFPGGAKEIRRALHSLAEKGRFAEGEAVQGLFMRAQRAGIIDAAGEIADPKVAAALGRAAPTGYLPHIATPGASEALSRHGQMTGARVGKARPQRLTAPRPEAIARTKSIHLRAPDGSVTKMLDTPEAASKIAGLKAEGYQVVGKFDISTAEWNRMASEGGLSQLTGPQYEGLAKFKGPLFEEDLAKAAGARVAREVRTDASKQFVDLVSPFGVDIPQGAQNLEKYAHLAPVNRPVEGNPFKVLEQTGIFNRQYPVQVADQINDMIRVYDQPEVIKSLLHFTDKGLGLWKSFQLYHPAYFIRNVWQNFFGGIMAGARPASVARFGWGQEGKLLRKALDLGDPNILGNASVLLSGRQMPLRNLYDDAVRFHLTGGGRTAQQMPTKFAGEAGTVTAARALEGKRKTLTGAIFKINTWFEDTQKLGTWMNFIDDGMDAQSAAMRTLVAMPDLSDLTHFEKSAMRRLIPFWSWMRKNGALQIFHFLPRKPAYANLMPKLKEFAEGFRGKENVPEELRAEWMREQMAWQVAGTGEQGTAFLPSTWLPFEELYAAGTLGVQPGEGARRLYTGMRPEIRFGTELATGYNAFRKQEYPRGSDITTPELAKAVPKAIMGKSGTQMDTLLGLRPAREWLPGGRVSEMKGPQAQAQRMVLGGALQPMDAEKGRRARYFELSKEIQTVRAQINRALQAGDQSLAENLQRKWMQLMVEMRRMGLPVPKATGAMMEKLAVPAGMGQ